MKGYQRNWPCPCGGGAKWKDCHPNMVGKWVDKDGKEIRDRHPVVTGLIKRVTMKEWEAYR